MNIQNELISLRNVCELKKALEAVTPEQPEYKDAQMFLSVEVNGYNIQAAQKLLGRESSDLDKRIEKATRN